MVIKDGSINSSNMHLFEYMEIDTCPSLIAFPNVELPTTLKELKIWRCEKLESLPRGWCTMIQIPPPPPVVVFMSWSLGMPISHILPHRQVSFHPQETLYYELSTTGVNFREDIITRENREKNWQIFLSLIEKMSCTESPKTE